MVKGHSPVAQWWSKKLLTSRLPVRVWPGEPSKIKLEPKGFLFYFTMGSARARLELALASSTNKECERKENLFSFPSRRSEGAYLLRKYAMSGRAFSRMTPRGPIFRRNMGDWPGKTKVPLADLFVES